MERPKERKREKSEIEDATRTCSISIIYSVGRRSESQWDRIDILRNNGCETFTTERWQLSFIIREMHVETSMRGWMANILKERQCKVWES